MPAPGAPQRRAKPVLWHQLDLVLIGATVLIGAFGCLMVYTATRVQLEAEGISPSYYVKKQIIFMFIGLVVMLVVTSIDYRRYRDWAPAIYGLSVFMLLAVYVVGQRSKGAQAWFQIGSYQLEPSEFVKIGLIVVLASYFVAAKGRLAGRGVGIVLLLSVVPFALIYKQPDLGTALVLVAVLVALLLVGGVSGRHMAILGVVGVIMAFGVVHFGVLKSYQQARLTSFVNTPNQPSAALLSSVAGANEYNQAESEITIGHGGPFGQGIGKGTQTNLSYVPSQQTDFIFSAVGEQVGLAGSSLLLLLFAIVIWRTWRAARESRDLLGTLLCVGVLAMLVFQVFENIGMAMGIMPVAGIPLPWMSYGGSAIIASFAGVGLVLNVRMRRFS